MPRSTASIQSEIDTIEAELAKAAKASSLSADGAAIQRQRYEALTKRLDELYDKLDQSNGDRKTFVRMRVTM
jgi:hypothetical protein